MCSEHRREGLHHDHVAQKAGLWPRQPTAPKAICPSFPSEHQRPLSSSPGQSCSLQEGFTGTCDHATNFPLVRSEQRHTCGFPGGRSCTRLFLRLSLAALQGLHTGSHTRLLRVRSPRQGEGEDPEDATLTTCPRGTGHPCLRAVVSRSGDGNPCGLPRLSEFGEAMLVKPGPQPAPSDVTSCLATLALGVPGP